VVDGVEVLTVGVGRVATVTIQVLQLRNWRSPETALRWYFAPRVVFGQAATLLFVAVGLAVMNWGVGGLCWLVAGVVLSFPVAVVDAWVLLVEIHRQRRRMRPRPRPLIRPPPDGTSVLGNSPYA
jgi:hypothetical protein